MEIIFQKYISIVLYKCKLYKENAHLPTLKRIYYSCQNHACKHLETDFIYMATYLDFKVHRHRSV